MDLPLNNAADLPTLDATHPFTPHLFHSRYFEQEQPVILKGATSLKEKWSLAYLSEQGGDVEGEIDISSGRDFPDTPAARVVTKHRVVKATLNEYVASAEKGTAAMLDLIREKDRGAVHDGSPHYTYFQEYIASTSMREAFFEAMPFQYSTSTTDYQLILHLGANDTVSELHYDCGHNVVHQLRGEKSFLMFAPETSPKLSPCIDHADANYHRFSHVNFSTMSKEQIAKEYPSALNAKAYIAKLQAGDMLYVPPMWWHQVFSTCTPVSGDTGADGAGINLMVACFF